MFTGIVQGCAVVQSLERKQGMVSYALAFPTAFLDGLQIGASVAVDGCCQTVVRIEKNLVYFDAIQETLDKTTIGSFVLGQDVNFERSLRFGSEIGGHLLSGHVFGTATLRKILRPDPQNVIFEMTCPAHWMQYIFEKGFIALDGASLTVNGPLSSEGVFYVHLIPETLRLTQFAKKSVGSLFNVEIDSMTQTIVQAVERILQKR